MTVFGLDASLNGTGYCYRSGDKLVHGRVTIKKERGTTRLIKVRDTLRQCLADSGADTVMYEDYAMSNRANQAFHIGELGGVLKVLCHSLGLRVLLVPPASLKLFTSGKGNSDKDAMMAAIEADHGLSFPNDDEADAFALMSMGEYYLDRRRARGLPNLRKEQLSKVKVMQ